MGLSRLRRLRCPARPDLRQELSLVKGFSARSPNVDARGPACLSDLVAWPLINLYHPELAGFVGPLSCEFAARRALLTSLPFPVGYGAALSLLLDAANTTGAPALAQTRLAAAPEADVPLPDLGEAAHTPLVAATSRAHGRDDLDEHAPGPLFLPLPGRFELRRVAVEERPPLGSIQPSAISSLTSTGPSGAIKTWPKAGGSGSFLFAVLLDILEDLLRYV